LRIVTRKTQGFLLDLIRSWEKNQLEFLISLCETNSYTFNKKGVDRVGAMVLDQLADIFPYHEVIENSEIGNHHILKTHEKGKSIYLLGHLDTVFPPDHPFQSCIFGGEWLRGPGTADMKGGLAVIIFALRSLVVSRNGKAGGKLQCSGRDRHVGSFEEEKASAILEIAHKVIAFESQSTQFPGIRINIGKIEGGLGPSTIPGSASFLFDLRWEKEEHFAPLLENLKQITSRSENPLCACQIEVLNYRPAMPRTEKTDGFLLVLKEAAAILKQKISLEHRYGTSDANYFGAAGVPALDGFGPVGIKDHTPEERILISSLIERTALLAIFLYNLKDSIS